MGMESRLLFFLKNQSFFLNRERPADDGRSERESKKKRVKDLNLEGVEARKRILMTT